MIEMDLVEPSKFATGNLRKLNITDYIKVANQNLKRILVESQLDVDGVEVRLVSSKTGFGGERLWFICPKCQRRSGVLYRRLNGIVRCRLCGGKSI